MTDRRVGAVPQSNEVDAAMILRKSDPYSSPWKSCDELRGGMGASTYKDYILTPLFVKYVSDNAKADKSSMFDLPGPGGGDV